MKKNYFSAKLRVFMLMLVLLAMGTQMADARDVKQARQAAMLLMKTHLPTRTLGKGGALAADLQLVYSKVKNSDEAYYYVFSAGKNQGYVMVSGDDRLPAIVGYTESGDFDSGNLPEGLAGFMENYQNFVDNATKEQIAETMAWKAQQKHAKVNPMMTEKWDQGTPYNNMCPEVSGHKCYTGCVATAIAQILHYWRYPENLKADITAYNTDSYNISLKGIKAGTEGTTYDWDNMLDIYTKSATAAQKRAVATLMLHVGCAVQMDYSPYGSGASATSSIFTNYFGMDKELVQQKMRSNYSIAEWDHMLYGEMEAKRPVYYSGSSTGGGHAFVIHGYDDGLYYVNWGWSGAFDGYYDITLLNPGSNVGAGSSTSDDGYSMQNDMIIGIQPDNGIVDDVTRQNSITCLSLTEKNVTALAMTNNTVTAKVKCTVANFNTTNVKKFIAIGYEKEDGSVVNITEKLTECDLGAMTSNGAYYYSIVDNDIKFTAESDKVYTLIAIESDDKITWNACLGAHQQAVKIKIGNGTATVMSAYDIAATVTLDNENGGFVGTENAINVTVTNTGNKEYYDIVNVMVSDKDEMPKTAVYSTGVTVPVDGSTTFNFPYTPAAAGTYYFWVQDLAGNLIGKGALTFEETSAPALSIVSIKCTNATEETVYAPYRLQDEVQMNKVNDTKAVFEFVIRNDGGYFGGNLSVSEYRYSNGSFSTNTHRVKIPGNSSQTLTFSVESNVGDVVGIRVQSGNAQVKLAGLAEPINHDVKDGKPVKLDNLDIVYLAGTNSDGIIDTVKDTDANGRIYTINGQYVGTDLNALRHGIYIVNGKKIVINAR